MRNNRIKTRDVNEKVTYRIRRIPHYNSELLSNFQAALEHIYTHTPNICLQFNFGFLTGIYLLLIVVAVAVVHIGIFEHTAERERKKAEKHLTNRLINVLCTLYNIYLLLRDTLFLFIRIHVYELIYI